MAFIFTMRSTPTSSMHRRGDPPSSGSLPAISEDSASFLEPRAAPSVPARSLNRPLKQSPLGYEGEPPPYSHFDESGSVTGPKGEKLADVRRALGNNKHIAKRGGWKRLAIIAAVVVACIIALGVGLGVGLKHKSSYVFFPRWRIGTDKSRNRDPGSSNGGASGSIGGDQNTTSNGTFPAGAYRFDTYLSSISTNCTSNPATWRCYPYFTYAQSPTQSIATFDWIITPTSTKNSYNISSTDNYFSILFTNASLTLANAGAADEHYYFQTAMQKPTKPVVQLGSQNVASTCYFNQTMLQGYLYTKMPKTLSSNVTEEMGGGDAFEAWPFAVRVNQVANAGVGTPTCVDGSGNSLGDFGVADTSLTCGCDYMNTGT